VDYGLTAASHLLISSLVQVEGSSPRSAAGAVGMGRVLVPPVGSGCAGNTSLPHIDHTATAVMRPVKAANIRRFHGKGHVNTYRKR
jgi:hypothetical protein